MFQKKKLWPLIKTTFFYSSDVVNAKTTVPLGSASGGGCVPRRFVSRCISTAVRLPLGGWLYIVPEIFKFLKYANEPCDDCILNQVLIKYDEKGYLGQFVSEMFDALQ